MNQCGNSSVDKQKRPTSPKPLIRYQQPSLLPSGDTPRNLERDGVIVLLPMERSTKENAETLRALAVYLEDGK